MEVEDGRGAVVTKGHMLYRSGPIIWCSRCAAYSQKRVRGLAKPCPRRVRARDTLDNLMAGRPPLARKAARAEYTPKRLTITEWLEWRRTEAPVTDALELIEGDELEGLD